MKFSTVYSSDPQLMWGYVNFPPFTSKNQEGQVEGFLADAARKVFKEAGVKFEAEEYPNRRIYSLLNNGDIQFGLFTRSFINDPANFVVSSFPIARAELRAYWVDDKSPITKIEDLKGQRIILLAAYTYGGLRPFFYEPVNRISIVADMERHDRAFEALRLGRGDYVLDYKGPSQITLESMGLSSLNHSQLKSLDIYFIIHKRIKDAETVMARMEKEYQRIYGDTVLTVDNQKDGPE